MSRPNEPPSEDMNLNKFSQFDDASRQGTASNVRTYAVRPLRGKDLRTAELLHIGNRVILEQEINAVVQMQSTSNDIMAGSTPSQFPGWFGPALAAGVAAAVSAGVAALSTTDTTQNIPQTSDVNATGLLRAQQPFDCEQSEGYSRPLQCGDDFRPRKRRKGGEAVAAGQAKTGLRESTGRSAATTGIQASSVPLLGAPSWFGPAIVAALRPMNEKLDLIQSNLSNLQQKFADFQTKSTINTQAQFTVLQTNLSNVQQTLSDFNTQLCNINARQNNTPLSHHAGFVPPPIRNDVRKCSATNFSADLQSLARSLTNAERDILLAGSFSQWSTGQARHYKP